MLFTMIATRGSPWLVFFNCNVSSSNLHPLPPPFLFPFFAFDLRYPALPGGDLPVHQPDLRGAEYIPGVPGEIRGGGQKMEDGRTVGSRQQQRRPHQQRTPGEGGDTIPSQPIRVPPSPPSLTVASEGVLTGVIHHY